MGGIASRHSIVIDTQGHSGFHAHCKCGLKFPVQPTRHTLSEIFHHHLSHPLWKGLYDVVNHFDKARTQEKKDGAPNYNLAIGSSVT